MKYKHILPQWLYAFANILLINLIVLTVLIGIAEFIGRNFLHKAPVEILRFINSELRVYLLPEIKDVFPKLLFSPRYRADQDMAWTLIPNKTVRRKNEDGEKWITKTTNEGFITPHQPKPYESQIITIGDSFLEGARNPSPIPKVISNLTGLPVYNLAAGGWGPDSYLAAFNRFGVDREAQVVIVFSFVNDAKDAEKYARWKDKHNTMTYERFLNKDRWEHASDNLGNTWFDRNLVVFNLVKYALSQYLPINVKAQRIEETVQLENQNETAMYFNNKRQFMYCSLADLSVGGDCFVPFQKYFESMDKLHKAISNSGKTMILAWIPTKERVYFEYLDTDNQDKYLKNETRQVVGVEQVIAWYANDRAILFLDLTDAMSAHAKKGKQLYFSYDHHLNGEGCQVAGEAAVEFIRNNKLNMKL